MAILKVAVTKAKGETVDINTETIPQEVYEYALALGLKTLVNRGTSKITKSTYPNAEELAAAALAQAAKQVEAIATGKIRMVGATKKSGVSGAVKTEAMRLARNLVKDELKRQKIKISHVEASEITKAARELLEASPELIEQATANLADREKTPLKVAIKVPVSAKKQAASEKAKAAKAGTLSAKQAGKVKPRAKGQGATA